jgi:hypothetical protein
MNPLSNWILCQTLLVAALSGPGYAATVVHQEHVDRINVVFVAPEKFADARRAEFKPNSEAILDALKL